MLHHSHLLKGKRVLVLGLGLSGQSAAQFLLNRQALVVGVDGNLELLTNGTLSSLCMQGMQFIHEDNLLEIGRFDLVVVSPGISPAHSIYIKALKCGLEVIGEAELACREITQKSLAVTGTNGKTTVTLMTAHILQEAGIKVKALGNIGVPLTYAVDDLSNENVDVFVIELSSFQLETLTRSFIDAGVILNITPDHLDRYSSIEHYALTKIGIEKNLKENGVLFVGEKCLNHFHDFFKTNHCFTYGYLPSNYLYTDTKDVYFDGKKKFSLPITCRDKRTHDVENLLASYALCQSLSISPEEFLIGLASFQKPAHRIEFVNTVKGVNYYDDSKGTNVDAAICAVQCLEGLIVLIAGGVDKGFTYNSWIDAFKGKVKAICAIGSSKEKIKEDLGKFIPVILFSDFDAAIAHAATLAKPGENVLLSPGCSSFDMFKDYAHRGQEFQRIVNALKENE